MFNDKEIIIFVPGGHGAFGEVVIVLSSQYFPVRMYKKGKQDKFIVGFYLGRCLVLFHLSY